MKKQYVGISDKLRKMRLSFMKDFYNSYNNNRKLQTLSAEISWSHNVALLTKCTDSLEREVYMRKIFLKSILSLILLKKVPL